MIGPRPTENAGAKSRLPKLAGRFICCLLLAGLSLARPPERDQAPPAASPPAPSSKFVACLPTGFRLPDSELGKRLLAAYGAVFVARGGAVPPPVIVFPDEESVTRWQKGLRTARERMGGIEVELQSPALNALLEARAEARKRKLIISPRARDAARRSYEQTVELWKGRVDRGLARWVRRRQLTRTEANRLRRLSPAEQAPAILALEEKGLYFGSGPSKAILSSVAAPGSSQHLSMLAFDVNENWSPGVRAILARHGWFQTVVGDRPHFTFLGVDEAELPSLGLKKVVQYGRVFWVPDL